MRKFLFLFILVFSFFISIAQTTNNVSAPTINGKNCILKQVDGNYFVGGIYKNAFQPFANTKIAVVNSSDLTENYTIVNLTANSNFANPNFDEVYSASNYLKSGATREDPVGLRYVAGDTGIYKSVVVNGFMRIFNNGNLDPSFTLNNSTTPYNKAVVRSFVIGADNKIILGGLFAKYFNVVKNNIVKLNENGTLDNTFNVGGSGFNGEVHVIKLQNDGKILVGGNFTSYNGVSKKNIVRLNTDGSIDNSFHFNENMDSKPIRAILIQNDGKVVIGGDFKITNLVNSPLIPKILKLRIARLNADGSLDDSFGGLFYKTSLSNGSNIAEVWTLSKYDNDKVFVGGFFDYYGNTSRQNVCLLNSSGNLESTFSPLAFDVNGNPKTDGPDNKVKDSYVESTGKVVIVGDFWKYNNIIKNGIAMLTPTGLAFRQVNNDSNFDEKETLINKQGYSKALNNEITIFPNPANDIITINSNDSEINSIDIFTIEGRKVYSKSIITEENSFEINIQDFSTGVFVVSIELRNGEIITQKIVKKQY